MTSHVHRTGPVALLTGATAGGSLGATKTVQLDLRRSSTMNALIYEQIARERHREAHSEARRLRQARALRAARRRLTGRRASG